MADGLELRWAKPALEDLKAARDFTTRADPVAAKRIAERIRARVLSLRDNPHLGRMVPEFSREELREIIVPPYRIPYHVNTHEITIVRVWHSRRDLETVPAE
ncbi:MAG: toxin ParE1/3/4 [Myxococcota bacterium]|jgi:toxin ParE1/3/4